MQRVVVGLATLAGWTFRPGQSGNGSLRLTTAVRFMAFAFWDSREVFALALTFFAAGLLFSSNPQPCLRALVGEEVSLPLAEFGAP